MSRVQNDVNEKGLNGFRSSENGYGCVCFWQRAFRPPPYHVRNVRAALCISVTSSGSTEVVDFGSQIDPHDSIGEEQRALAWLRLRIRSPRPDFPERLRRVRR